MEFQAVILAAGESNRFGAQKLMMPFRGRTMIEYAIEAALPWTPAIVAGIEVAAHLGNRPNLRVIVNMEQQRGMTHSLALANAAIPQERALIVLLGDKPLVGTRLIAQVSDALEGADVVYPRHPQTGEPGHPVIFSPRARTRIASLPDGDSLRELRDDPELVHREIAITDLGAYFDVDTASSLEE